MGGDGGSVQQNRAGSFSQLEFCPTPIPGTRRRDSSLCMANPTRGYVGGLGPCKHGDGSAASGGLAKLVTSDCVRRVKSI